MNTPSRILLGGSLVAALAAGTLGLVAVRAQETPDYGALVKSLGEETFGARSKAWEALESAGAAARGALEEGAKSEDEQVRWSARRLLRRLDGEAGAPLRVLRFDEDARPAPGLPDMDEAFRDMDRRMEELNRRFEGLRGGLRFDLQPGLPGIRGERRSVIVRDGERIDVHEAADGRVTVKIGVKGPDGKTTEESFEAADMAALGKEHPEVARKVEGLLGGRPEIRGLPGPEAPARPSLGVTVSEVPPVLRTQLSIEEGAGLVVEEVLPGTPAARIGLRRHDVLLAVNGTPVSSAAGVRAAVGAVKEGGELLLRVLRGGKTGEFSGTR